MVFREWFWPFGSYYWQMDPAVVCACPWKGNTMRWEAEVNRAIDQYSDMVLRLCMVKRKCSRKLWEVRLLENKTREALGPLHADQALKRKAIANIRGKTFDYGRNLYQLRRHRQRLAGSLAALALVIGGTGLWFTPSRCWTRWFAVPLSLPETIWCTAVRPMQPPSAPPRRQGCLWHGIWHGSS